MSPTEPLFQTKAFTPTPEQLAIQTASARSLLIEANAGAAKTTTLALRMAESWQRGTAPDAFLALVHTDTACLALHAALRKIGVPAAVRQRMRIATFEQFCTQLLADPGARAVPVPVLATPEQLRPRPETAAGRSNHAGGCARTPKTLSAGCSQCPARRRSRARGWRRPAPACLSSCL